MLTFLLFKKTTVFKMHSIITVMTKERFYFLFFNVTKRNRKSRKQMSNVWVVRLTCVSRETFCSVFMSVSVIQCNVCAYVALHFQRLPCLNIMKSVTCDSRDCENMSVL